MNRQFSPRTQGIALVIVGVVAVVVGVVLKNFGHLDAYAAQRTPVLIAVGVTIVIVGMLRLRGKITN